MTDLLFDPIKRDMIFSTDGTFEVSSDQSTLSKQNGTIMLEARAMNIIAPIFGIGYNSQILGSNSGEAAKQLNRWNTQITQDSGKSNWVRIPSPPGQDFDFSAQVNYNQ